ncbi:AraC family transcriptional regulator [Paenibacillus sepulcri]|uniref:AraC family transcriptional regulator n=1 Tax=Paenibacillus sepulcri TaxID=359917 RepID=A0ABS7C721_9BACL|nr:AraC family transcriptional regulator [Paenibacillus sepulcri]
MYNDVMLCSYSYHSHPFQVEYSEGLSTYLFRLQTEGSCEALVNGRMERIEAGDLLLFKPGDPYELNIVAGSQTTEADKPQASSGDYFVICNGPWLDEWWARKERPQKTKIVSDERLLSIWRALVLEKRRFEQEDREMADYLLRSLCLGLDRAVATQSVLHGKSFIATRMKNFIDEQAGGPFLIQDVASHVGLSVSRTVHLFKECFGVTIIQYTQDVRLSMAMERMKFSTMPLEQIAETCGFGSYSYFYRIFRRQFGMSPAVYREQQI